MASTRPGAWRALIPRHIRNRPQLSIAAAIFVATAAIVPWGMPPATRTLIAFDAGAIAFLAAVWLMLRRATPATMKRRAQELDERKWSTLALSVVVAAAVLLAIGVELRGAKEAATSRIALAGTTILLSWLFTNTLFALRYAHAYYSDRTDSTGGLSFPGTDRPDYWDFLYFAWVIGMTFQVSDVQITGRHLRHIVTGHGALSFFFTVIVVAIAVNIVATAS